MVSIGCCLWCHSLLFFDHISGVAESHRLPQAPQHNAWTWLHAGLPIFNVDGENEAATPVEWAPRTEGRRQSVMPGLGM